MKITKTKEVVTEEIEIKAGIYYFEDENLIIYKFTLGEPEDEYTEYTIETVRNFANTYGIRVFEDEVWNSESLPYEFRQFILGIAGKEITKEEFDKEKQEVLNKLNR